MASPGDSAQTAVSAGYPTTGYFSDLAGHSPLGVYCGGKVDWQLVDLGGHRMSGPPSVAGTCWTVAAMNVPTTPTIRSIVLIALFMGSSPITAVEIRREELPSGAEL